MKIIKIGLSLLLASSLFANDKKIVDTTHKKVVNTLDENVKVLPEDLQDTAKELIDDIDKDGKNINIGLKLTYFSSFNGLHIGAIEVVNKSTIFATANATFLPNTWKINLAYTGTIESLDDETTDSYTGKYAINETPKDTQIINIYMKPISTKYGNIGFGYKFIEKSNMLKTDAYVDSNYDPSLDEGPAEEILDIKSPYGSGAIYLKGEYRYAIYNTKLSKYFLTYNIPSKNTWYEGFGFIYGYEKSNLTKVIKDNNGKDGNERPLFILKPDVTSHIMGLGINKTFDELHNGFNIETFTIGTMNSDYTFYNYSINKEDSGVDKRQYTDIAITYILNKKKSKQIFLTAKYHLDMGEYNDNYSETIFEFGMIF